MRAAAVASLAVGLLVANTVVAAAERRILLASAQSHALQLAVTAEPAVDGNSGSSPLGTAEPALYAVTLNGQAHPDSAFLRLSDGRLLASAADFRRWRLRPPSDVQFQFEDEVYYALDGIPGYRAEIDDARQAIKLDFAPAAFQSSLVSARRLRPVTPQPPPGLGAFLNYDVTGTRTEAGDAEPRDNLSSITELGLFNGWGVGTSQWLGLNLTEETSGSTADGKREFVRLETGWTRDLPDRMESFRVGDGVGAAGLWGRPLRYGGLRWSRNFATQPGFVTLPQPSLSGETALPSVLDVYVDGLRRQRHEVPAGPFEVQDLPTISGQGEVQIVVRDLLGREQVLTDSYIAGNRQLRAGLHDFSYEAGFAREQFGRESNEYGDFFASTTQRYGFNDDLTGEVRVEGSADIQALGLGAVFTLPPLGVVSNAFVVSQGEAGTGTSNTLTLQRQLRRGVSIGGRLQVSSADFTQLGLAPGASLPRRSASANVGFPVPRIGNLGFSYVSQQYLDPAIADVEAVTGRLSTGFRRVNLSLLAIQRVAPDRELVAGLNLSIRFGYGNTGSAGYQHTTPEDGEWSARSFARLQRNLPADDGFGYRLQVSESHAEVTDRQTRAEAGGFLNARYGSYGLEVSDTELQTSYRATVSGGLGTMAGHVFASRKLGSSFAVVETGAEDLELLVNNRPAARTNADGVAVLPRLQPYRDNNVRVNAAQLPLLVDLKSAQVEAVPYFRSGMLISLDAKTTRGAVLTLHQADGTPVPAGATVTLVATGTEFPVARNGQAFVSGLDEGDNTIEARWNGTVCRLRFSLPANAGVQPQLGPFQCQAGP